MKSAITDLKPEELPDQSRLLQQRGFYIANMTQYFWISFGPGSLCVSLADKAAFPGNFIVAQKFTTGDYQMWSLDEDYNVIRSKINSDVVLEEGPDGFVIANAIEEGNEKQQWVLKDGRLCRKSDESMQMTLYNGFVGNFVNVQSDADPELQNELTYVSLDYFYVMTYQGLCLTVSSMEAGAIVALVENAESYNQKWYVSTEGVLRAACNGYTLSMKGASLQTINAPEGCAESKWMRNENSIISNLDETECLEAQDVDGQPDVVTATFTGSQQQTWTFQPV